MSTWTKSTLAQECSIAIGGTPARNREDYWDFDKRTSNHWVAISDLHGRYVTSTSERISDEGVRNSNVKLVERGSVLLSFKLTLGRTAIAGVDLYTNEAIAALRSGSLEHLFLHYGLQSWDLLGDVDQAIKGATLNKAKLKRIPISFPKDKKVQERIAVVLDTMDRVIEQTESMLVKQQRIKTGLMHDLLTRGLDAHGELRDPSTHRFKKTDIGEMPFEWEVVTLESLVPSNSPICYGIVQVGPHTHGGVPTIAIHDFDHIRVESSHRTDPAREKLFTRSRCQGGDVLIAIKGATAGKIGFVPQGFHGNISRDIARVRLLPSECPAYFKHQLLDAAGQLRLGKISVGTTRKELSILPLRQLLVSRPKPDEQQAIAVRIEKCEGDLKELEDMIAKLRRLKTGLMQDLLTGEVSVAPLLAPKATNC